MEIIKKLATNDFIDYEKMDSNSYVEYLKLKDNKTVHSYGRIVKKLTRNLYIINDVDTKENYTINKTDIINKIGWVEKKETKSNDFTFLLIGFLILIGIVFSIFSAMYSEAIIKNFINEINISMFGLDNWITKLKYN
jgi:hypothetical protein